MNTYSTKQSDIKRAWHLIDVKDKVLGRISTVIAQKLIGKTKPYFTSHLDCGDYVVVINSNLVKVTGRKKTDKIYSHHTNYPSGLRQIPFDRQLKKDSRRIIVRAVSNMLPKNKLRAPRLKRLKVFKADDHIYQDKLSKAVTPGVKEVHTPGVISSKPSLKKVKKGDTLTGDARESRVGTAKPEGVTLKKPKKVLKQTKTKKEN
ncbi:MAG: 50S ribosomal protein L13 [Candidatus Beckwithbacteria bacterium]|nr:50S ribosomal protein L13 [Patescibacteria group bacterium]